MIPVAFLDEDIKRVEDEYKKTDLYHQRLLKLFTKVIDDVRESPMFPEDAQEILYESLDKEGVDLFLIKNMRDSYALTKKGVLKTWRLKKVGEPEKLLVLTIPAEKFINEETPFGELETIRKSLTDIIKKYQIGIRPEDYKEMRIGKDK